MPIRALRRGPPSSTRRDATGRTTTFGYDVASQLQTIAYSDGTTPGVDFDYDELGRRKQMVDGSGTSTWTYDSLGRLKTAKDGSGRTLTYTYDLGGNLTKIGYPAGLVAQTAPGQTVADPSVTRTYDDAGRMRSVKDWLNSTTELDYDPDGNLTEQRYPNGVKATFAYDRAGQLTSRSDALGSTTLLDLPYTRKTTGQVETQNQTGVAPVATATMSYDVRHQLTGVSGGGLTESYTHDDADRLTGMAGANPAIALDYDDANQLLRTRDPVTNATRTSFTYDDAHPRRLRDRQRRLLLRCLLWRRVGGRGPFDGVGRSSWLAGCRRQDSRSAILALDPDPAPQEGRP